LRHVNEARIAQIEVFFESIKFREGNRNSIESALKRHPRIFELERKGREKYISLKGEKPQQKPR
jgi:hypothetical protein